MKRLIFLKVEYLEVDKKMSKAKEQEARTKLCRVSINQFKKDIKEWLDNKSIQITKEYDTAEPSVLISFDEKILCEVVDKLRKVDIVNIIDSIIPKEGA
jgi:hypothetical protein